MLIGGTLFHLLPDIAEGSSEELNQGLTSIVLITISLMVVLDSVVEFNFKSIKKEAHVAPVAAVIELQSASKVGPTASATYSVAIAPSVEATNKKPDVSDVQLQQLSYLTLLRQTDVFTNLVGEAIHNLTDGIAIATAFTLSWETGILVPRHFTLKIL